MSRVKDCSAYAIIGFRVKYDDLRSKTVYECQGCGKILKKKQKCCKKNLPPRKFKQGTKITPQLKQKIEEESWERQSRKTVYCSEKLVIDYDDYDEEGKKKHDTFKKFVGGEGRKWKVYNKRVWDDMPGSKPETKYVYICVEIVGSGVDWGGETKLNFGDLSLNLKQKQLKEDVESAQEGLWGLGMFGLFSVFECVPW